MTKYRSRPILNEVRDADLFGDLVVETLANLQFRVSVNSMERVPRVATRERSGRRMSRDGRTGHSRDHKR